MSLFEIEDQTFEGPEFNGSEAKNISLRDARTRGMLRQPRSIFILVLLACYVSAERHCVFLHGVGETLVANATTEDTTSYWGGTENIKKYTPFCTSYAFAHQDTKNNGWDSPLLQEAYCIASGASDGGMIHNTAVFSHSMGNLIFAGALENKTCSLGPTSDWYSASAPWRGSDAVPWLQTICNGSFPNIDPEVRWLANKLDYCDGEHTATGYLSILPSYPGLVDGRLAGVASKFLSGAMCGSSAVGLITAYSAPLKALSEAVGELQ